MDSSQVIASVITASFVLGLVAYRLLWAGSQLSAGVGLRRFPSTWIPKRLRQWLFGEVEAKPTR